MSAKTSNQPLAIAALVLGIISVVTFVFYPLSIVLGILAIIFGSVSLKSSDHKKARAGMITGIIGLVLSILVVCLGVFAYPALLSGQKDAARRNDISNLNSQIMNFQSNNRGQLPTNQQLKTNNLSQINSISTSGEPTEDTALYLIGTNCRDESVPMRHYSVRILLENGKIYCQD